MEAMETAEVRPEDMAAALAALPAREAAHEAAHKAAERAGFLRSAGARIAAWDSAVIRWLSALTLPKAVNLALVFLVRIGDGWIWALVAAGLFYVLPMPELKQVVAHCLVAIAVSLAFYWPVKLSIRRKRPHESGLGVTAKVPPLDKFSFPSGHTMNNLAVALTMAVYVPGVWPLALGLPLLLGALRVLFGVHYLSDIVGGALLGSLSYVLARQAFLFF